MKRVLCGSRRRTRAVQLVSIIRSISTEYYQEVWRGVTNVTNTLTLGVSWREDCSLVDCAPPYCPYTYPITLDGHCCESCAPDYCATVDCVVPECDDLIYTAANICCGLCRTPVETCPDGTARLECGDGGVCDTETCTNFPAAECRPDVCNECEPVFYDVNGDTISQCTG